MAAGCWIGDLNSSGRSNSNYSRYLVIVINTETWAVTVRCDAAGPCQDQDQEVVASLLWLCPGHTALVLAEVGLSHALPHLTPGHHTSNLLRKKFKC